MSKPMRKLAGMLGFVIVLAGCSRGSANTTSATCRSLDSGITQVHQGSRHDNQPSPPGLIDAKDEIAGRKGDFDNAVRVVADRYITIWKHGITGQLPSAEGDALRSAVAFVETQCSKVGVRVNLDRAFSSE